MRLPLVGTRLMVFNALSLQEELENAESPEGKPRGARLLRTLFPDLYPVRKLLVDHHELPKPGGFSEMVQMDVSVSHHLYPERATPYLWLGMILQVKGDLHAAAAAFNRSKALLRHTTGKPLSGCGDFSRATRRNAAAARERAAPLARWGSVRFGCIAQTHSVTWRATADLNNK